MNTARCKSFSDCQRPANVAGEPLTGDAWVARLRTPLEEAVAEEKAGYERGLAAGPKYPVNFLNFLNFVNFIRFLWLGCRCELCMWDSIRWRNPLLPQ